MQLVYDGERVEVTNLRLRLVRLNRFHDNYVVMDPIVVDHYAITDITVRGECGRCEGEESVPCDLVEDEINGKVGIDMCLFSHSNQIFIAK